VNKTMNMQVARNAVIFFLRSSSDTGLGAVHVIGWRLCV
jgi:hypothetical protein